MPKPKLSANVVRTQFIGGSEPNFCDDSGRCSCRQFLRIVIETPMKWSRKKRNNFLRRLESFVDKED